MFRQWCLTEPISKLYNCSFIAGQYHEVNPGQYDERDPGRYYKGHEGRYQNLESAYPGDYEVNEVKVDFDNRDEHKIYNVQAKAGDFIIGEVGKIDVNNGQTVEVTLTAVLICKSHDARKIPTLSA